MGGAMDVTFTWARCYDPPMNHACEHGPFCNSCLAYVHDGWFGAVYPQGNSMKFSGNEYLSMDGRPITDRPIIRTDNSDAHIAAAGEYLLPRAPSAFGRLSASACLDS